MKINLADYSGLKICVAVSGGKDSMALLRYLFDHCAEYGITLSALNCDHKLRGKASARDSAFVKNYCKKLGVPCRLYEWKGAHGSDEQSAREWRLSCYRDAIKPCVSGGGTEWAGADVIATAHHMNDNAETVLFNLARGSALSGMAGIASRENRGVKIIRPLLGVMREEIDEYISKNNIPFVTDETNLTDKYTRNRIRQKVLPELEKCVPDAVKAIYRFSRLAAEDEEYFDKLIEERKLIKPSVCGCELLFCEEKAVFRRAALKALKSLKADIKDYTSAHLERLYLLQFAENGKKFGFLNITAFKEEGKIAFVADGGNCETVSVSFLDYQSRFNNYGGQFCKIFPDGEELVYSQGEKIPEKLKALKFDYDRIPESAVIRFMKEGDRFTKFGGGTKNLGDFFTDKKIPVRLRAVIPLIADGSDILAVCGVEISDKIKLTEKTRRVYCILCADYAGY